ncbi:MAG: alpha/beta hydrolase [Polyangiaceae bacterium]
MSYVGTRLGRWYYEEWGSSRRAGDPTFVLCHGLFFDGGCWRSQAEALSAFGRVIVLDGPGHGRSEVPPAFTLEDHADALVDVCEGLRFDKAVWAGISWGGMIGMRLALRHPERVAGLALFDTNADGQRWTDRLQYRGLVGLVRAFGLSKALVETRIVPEMFGATTIRERPDLVATFVSRLLGAKQEGIARAANAVLVTRRSILRELPTLRVPSLVVVGEEDVATPKPFADAIGLALGAGVHVVPRAGHTISLEAPEAVDTLLTNFAKRVLG